MLNYSVAELRIISFPLKHQTSTLASSPYEWPLTEGSVAYPTPLTVFFPCFQFFLCFLRFLCELIIEPPEAPKAPSLSYTPTIMAYIHQNIWNENSQQFSLNTYLYTQAKLKCVLMPNRILYSRQII